MVSYELGKMLGFAYSHQDCQGSRTPASHQRCIRKSRAGLGALQLALFEEIAEAKLWHPTYIIDYPVEVPPLARASATQPGITERFELYITGPEIANGFSELNDPEDQAERFRAQDVILFPHLRPEE